MAVALPYIFYAAVAASTAVAVTSSIQASRDAKTAANMQAQAAQQQAQAQSDAARNNATSAIQQADAEAKAIRDRNLRTAGTQRTNFLKSGVTLSGSALDVIYDSSVEGELDALNAEYKGQLAYKNYYDESKYALAKGQSDAQMAIFEGKARSRAYTAQAVGSFFQGVGQAAGGPSFGKSTGGKT